MKKGKRFFKYLLFKNSYTIYAEGGTLGLQPQHICGTKFEQIWNESISYNRNVQKPEILINLLRLIKFDFLTNQFWEY